MMTWVRLETPGLLLPYSSLRWFCTQPACREKDTLATWADKNGATGACDEPACASVVPAELRAQAARTALVAVTPEAARLLTMWRELGPENHAFVARALEKTSPGTAHFLAELAK